MVASLEESVRVVPTVFNLNPKPDHLFQKQTVCKVRKQRERRKVDEEGIPCRKSGEIGKDTKDISFVRFFSRWNVDFPLTVASEKSSK